MCVHARKGNCALNRVHSQNLDDKYGNPPSLLPPTQNTCCPIPAKHGTVLIKQLLLLLMILISSVGPRDENQENYWLPRDTECNAA
eukprot:1028522-Pelagomonas_calceolata.AAC.2